MFLAQGTHADYGRSNSVRHPRRLNVPEVSG
jgi:hypothetical protein